MRLTTIMKVGLIASILLSLSVNIVAQGGGSLKAPEGKTQRVRFARGRTTAVLNGAVVRATQDRYILGAREGQTMIVHVTSREKNAVFTILDPSGTALAGTDEGSDAMDWTGELPLSGDYSIWVSPTRGNATYTLEVTIR
ncbi:MAG: hypothetical protein ND866_20080 [Pyrinomonadaceae bacterium]|nr:hypothetical protein [Pyrinomonadaceae bacterium]